MTRVLTFPRGGIKLPPRKGETRDIPLENAPLPPLAIVALRQHRGPTCECLVQPGATVAEGELIGKPADRDSAAVHAPIPGRVREIVEVALPDGSRGRAVAIELGGSFAQSGRPREHRDWHHLPPEELLSLVRDAGVVGVGGEPVAPGWGIARRLKPDLLAANGVECEPFLAAEHRLLLERPREIAAGLLIARRILGAARTVLAVTSRHAAEGVAEACQAAEAPIEPVLFTDRYPQDDKRQLVAALQSSSRPPRGACLDQGVVVTSVATLAAVWDAVVLGRPHIERVLTVAGPGVRGARNLKVRIGTPVRELLEEAGGLRKRHGAIVLGGPMRGRLAASADVPVTKEVTAVIVLGQWESRSVRPDPCIRCGRCDDACPWGLAPSLLHKLVRAALLGRAAEAGLDDCAECGCCSYVCPSRIPLTAIFAEARRERGEAAMPPAGGAA